jgi:hypothetical protein
MDIGAHSTAFDVTDELVELNIVGRRVAMGIA